MELVHTFRVDLPVDDAFRILTDLERVAPCMPGAELREVDGDEYRGVMRIKLGAISAEYQGTARVTEADAIAHRAALHAKGRDTRGQGNATAVIRADLREDAGGTVVDLHTDLTLTGRVAQFGRGVVADVSTKVLGQFVANLVTTLGS